VLALTLIPWAGMRAAETAPVETLNLSALLAEAEAANPGILAVRARLRAAEHAPSQMQALPDPVASISYTNESLDDFTLGSTPDSNLAFSWTQEVPYPGKRGLAGDVARAEIDVVGRDLDAARLRVLAAVKMAYADLLRLDRTTSIVEESKKLLVSFRDTARVRYETGEGILENVLKAQTEIVKLDAELAILAQERRSIAVSLNALVGRRTDLTLGPALAPPVIQLPDRETLEQAAVDRSPELLGLKAATHREESRLRLAEKELKPDFMWGASYMNRGGLDPMVMGMFGLRIPLYRKQKQAEAVVQTRYDLEAAERDLESREVSLRAEVRDSVARAERAGILMQLYDQGILPQAQSALDSAAASYGVGRADFLTLLDDFLTVLEYERDYEMQRAEEIKATAGLEPLTGLSLVMRGNPSLVPRPAGGSQ